MADAPSVVAIVVNWRLAEATLHCLADLRACGVPGLEVAVIDNGSDDGSVERLRAGAPHATLIALPENSGYCAAVNRGLRHARERGARPALLLNNDLRLAPGFLPPLVEVLDNDPSVAGVMPTVLGPDGRVWSCGGDLRFGPNLVALRHQGAAPPPRTLGPQLVGFLPGACALYRLADLAAVGDLDEAYWMYMEDADLGLRLRRMGRKLLWIPWVHAVHVPGSSSGGARSPLRKFLMGANEIRLLRAHGTARLWLAFLLCDLLAAPLALLGGAPRGGVAKLRGILAGIRGRRLDAAVLAGLLARA